MIFANASHRERALDDVTERGMALYDSRLGATLEANESGKVVAIEPDSGDFAVADDSAAAIRALRARNVNGLVLVRRIGEPTAEDRRFAARIAAAEAQAK